MEITETDVAIIGGGPAGCTCALYTSRSNLKTVIIDQLRTNQVINFLKDLSILVFPM